MIIRDNGAQVMFIRARLGFILAAIAFSVTGLLAQDQPEALLITGPSGGVDIFLEVMEGAGVEEIAFAQSEAGETSGIQALCTGIGDVAVSYEPISSGHLELCTANGISFNEVLLGNWIVALVRNQEPSFDQVCLTTDDLDLLLSPSAAGNGWDVLAGLDDTTALVTFAFDDPTAIGLLDGVVKGDGIRADVTLFSDPDALFAAIKDTSGALGIVPLAVLVSADLPMFELNLNAFGCVQPTVANAEDRLYSLAQPLYLYMNSASIDTTARTAIADAISSAPAGAVLSSRGVSPATDDAQARNRLVLLDDLTGRQHSIHLTSYSLPPNVAGSVDVVGSASGNTILTTASTALSSTQPSVLVSFDIAGEPAGLRRLCSGEVDIAVVSSDVEPSGLEGCVANGIDLIELNLGSEAVVMLANDGNSDAACLTTEQVAQIWSASEAAPSDWSDISPEFQPRELVLFGQTNRPEVTDRLLASGDGVTPPMRTDAIINADPLYRAAAVANVDGGLTYMTWQEYQGVVENDQARIQLVAVDRGDECTVPDASSILDGTYPLASATRLLIPQASLADPAVQAYLLQVFADDMYATFQEAGVILAYRDLGRSRASLIDAFAEANAPALPLPESTQAP
jgi:phosphate transport system substrate-binding protein